MPNFIRLKQINQPELSGFFIDSISSESGLLLDLAEQAALNIFSSGTVHLTGNQTISGVKTFATGIIAPNLIYNTGDQTISGNKTFATGIIAPNLIYNTGNQTISGNKTFANNIQVSGTGVFKSLDLNVDFLNLSGVDVSITSGFVVLTNPISAPNIVYNTGNQTISGVKTFTNINSSGLNIVGGDLININNSKTIASSNAAGLKGDICWDSNYLYVCVANNTWKRFSGFSW